jgi:hypothetical protein
MHNSQTNVRMPLGPYLALACDHCTARGLPVVCREALTPRFLCLRDERGNPFIRPAVTYVLWTACRCREVIRTRLPVPVGRSTHQSLQLLCMLPATPVELHDALPR